MSNQYRPQTCVLLINNEVLQLVNWQDYRGWEARYATVRGEYARLAEFVGYVHEHADHDGEWWALGEGGDCHRALLFRTRYEALKALLEGVR